MVQADSITIRVRKQDSPSERMYYEDYTLTSSGDETVAQLLARIALSPPGEDAGVTSPVVWEEGCGTGDCGSCSMLINGKPMLACSAKVTDFPPAPITLEPLSKFRVIRDLFVDRRIVFESLAKVEAWLEPSGYDAAGEQTPIPPEKIQLAQEYRRCINCGICVEVCPGCNPVSEYAGPHAVASCASYLLISKTGENSRRLLESMMKPAGITGCGNAMNCVTLCPREIDLTTAIAYMNSSVNQVLKRSLFGK